MTRKAIVKSEDGKGLEKATLSVTYQIVTEESAEQGEAAESGFLWEDVPHTLREIIDAIESGGFIHPSCSSGVPNCLSSEPEIDYYTGETEIRSIHPGRGKRSQRYWEKAIAYLDNKKFFC